jgi:hypothetical protein
MANKYSVLLKILVNSNSHLVFEFEGKIKFITVTQYQNVSDASMILKFRKKIYKIKPSKPIWKMGRRTQRWPASSSGTSFTKLFTAVIYECANQARLPAPGRISQPILLFAGISMRLPKCGAPHWRSARVGSGLVKFCNICPQERRQRSYQDQGPML